MKAFILLLVSVLGCWSQSTPLAKFAIEYDESDTNRISHINLMGDEAQIPNITASPRSFLNKQIVLFGVVSIRNYFNYGYEDASSTHYSLKFAQMTEDMRQIGTLDIYANRKFAKPMVDALLKNEAKGHGKIVRIKVCVTDRSFQYGDFQESAELLDWQFLNEGRDGWTPWAMESLAIENTKAEAKRTEQLQEQRRISMLAQQKKAKEANDKALKFNQEQADKGDVMGLLRMGERYRDGDGVEKDLTKAKIYFQKAVDKGSPTAATALEKLN